MLIAGTSPDHSLVEIIELPDHPWFVAVQFHPEFKSKPTEAASAVRRLHRRRRGKARHRPMVGDHRNIKSLFYHRFSRVVCDAQFAIYARNPG